MHTIEETKKSYDAACKEVLADRYILANILKECVEEFRDESIEFIACECIQGSPEISTVPVRADESVRLRLDGLNTEDTSLTEAVIHYDIRFRAILPREGKPIKLIINVEAQNNFSPGYSLLKRAIYYCCRMISAQYGTVFTRSSYDAMEKVYSIWICTNPSAGWEYTITKYVMQERSMVGNARANMDEYDLIVPIMVCLGKKKYRELQGLFRLLNMVLMRQSRDDRSEVLNELKDNYNVVMTPHLEKGVAQMCNLSEGVYQDGVAYGLEQGRKLSEGVYQDGVAYGLEQGRKLSEGVYQDGVAHGLEQGLERGLERGLEQGRKETVLALLREKMPLDLIVRVTTLSAEKIRDIGKLNGIL